MLSLRKVLSVLAVGVLATGMVSSPVEAAKMHHHRANQAASSSQVGAPLVRAIAEQEFQSEFTTFMKAHDKEYTVDELFVRYNIFKDNYKFIVKHNAEADAGKHTHRVGVNWLADMSNAEYKSKMLTYKAGKATPAPSMEEWEASKPAHWKGLGDIPDYWDWREHNAVTDVKNQGQCGSCWSFGSTAAVECAHARATGQLISLSEQQLMDCDSNNADGCNGGYVEGAYDYIQQAGGQASNDAYPYTGAKGGCAGVQGGAAATVSGHQQLPQDEGAIVQAVANQGVLSVVIDASDQSFQLYQSGIFSGPCGTALDHAIAIVGYGWDQPSGKSFWIMKNSWGNWGSGGYIWMERGNNMCGCNSETAYPTA